MIVSVSAPNTAPVVDPRPPVMETPPSTTAAIDSRIKLSPIVGDPLPVATAR